MESRRQYSAHSVRRGEGESNANRLAQRNDVGVSQRQAAHPTKSPNRSAQRTYSASKQQRSAAGQANRSNRSTQHSARVSQPQQHARQSHTEHSAEARHYSRSSYAQNHSRNSTRKPRWFFAVMVILALAVIAVLVFALSRCGGTAENQGAMQTATTQAEPGRIVMTLRGSADTMVLKGESYIEPGCRATDKQEGDISASIETQGSVDTSKTGDYTVTYVAYNSQNAQSSTTRNVHVVDSMDKDTDGIAVMMYHYIYDEANPPEKAAGNTNYLSNTKFEAQLKWLKEKKYYFPSFKELSAYIAGTHSLPAKSVILTFDDGEEGFLNIGVPLLEKYSIPATSFIICNRDDASSLVVDYANPYLDFQSHTYACHQDGNTNIGRGGHIYDLSQEQLVNDLKQAASICGSNEAMAYPYGDVSDVAPAACKEAGILCSFTIKNGLVTKGADITQLPRMRVLADSSLASWVYEVEHGTGS